VGHAHRALFSRIFPPLLVGGVVASAVSRFLSFRLVQFDDELVFEETSEAKFNPGVVGGLTTRLFFYGYITLRVGQAKRLISVVETVRYCIRTTLIQAGCKFKSRRPKIIKLKKAATFFSWSRLDQYWIFGSRYKTTISDPDPQQCFFMKLIVSVGAVAPYPMLRTLRKEDSVAQEMDLINTALSIEHRFVTEQDLLQATYQREGKCKIMT
jgi:hypothetical protein